MRSDSERYLTQSEPTVLHGMTWYWIVAGKQFLCSFHAHGGDKARAKEALLRYVQESLPAASDDSRLVVGPCCVPEGGDFPRPLPAEDDD